MAHGHRCTSCISAAVACLMHVIPCILTHLQNLIALSVIIQSCLWSNLPCTLQTCLSLGVHTASSVHTAVCTTALWVYFSKLCDDDCCLYPASLGKQKGTALSVTGVGEVSGNLLATCHCNWVNMLSHQEKFDHYIRIHTVCCYLLIAAAQTTSHHNHSQTPLCRVIQ